MGTTKIAARHASVVPDFSGSWVNELGSSMELDVNGTVVTGSYRTAVGEPDPGQPYPLSGVINDDLIVFNVDWLQNGSISTWAGQLTMIDGQPVIETMWYLVRQVPDPKEPTELWADTLAGSDRFQRPIVT